MVISNHPDMAEEVRSFGVPFFYVPSAGPDKSAAEAEHLRLLQGNVDFVVLARYMQILSGEFIERARRADHQHPPLVPARPSSAPVPTRRPRSAASS